MNIEDQERPTETTTNDENNNNCEYTKTMIGPDISSDEEYYCSSDNDSELIPLDTHKLWHDLAHIIKCIYRETNREFTENHSTNDICKAKEYVQILTQSNSESLFNKIELIVLEYVDEIRNQVLKRSQTYLKTSNDVQLFISYLLDEYNTFIQAAKNVSTIVSYLEEHYMKSFHLTWLFYNKHLYEKLVYMDKKIQHSMSIMIDLLQPSSNENTNDYSPAEYTQLLNRFLAFDEEMSEIACLYKDCQAKMISISRRNRVTMKKTKANLNSSTTNAVNIPLSINSPTIAAVSQQDSNGSSIGSGTGGKESSSISSFDEYSLGNNTSSSSYTKEESETNHEELDHEISNEEKESTLNGKRKSKSTHRKDNSNPMKTSLTPDLILPPKPPSKLQADFRPLAMPLLTKTEIPACPSLLSAKIQSVSFTAGTFGSITTNESSINRKQLSLNLSRKSDSTIALNNFNQLLRQAASPNEISAFLSTLESTKSIDELSRDKNCDLCCCDLFSESNPNDCVACMSLPNPTAIACTFNQRGAEVKERLKLKFTKRTVQNVPEQSKLSTGNKMKTKPCDNNIDDLVRFIDGDETTSTEGTSKKNKKKNKSTPKNTNMDSPQPVSKKKKKKQSKTEEPIDESSTIKPPTPPPPEEKSELNPKKIESSSENPISPEEEVNWITISRKQSKHKPTSVPSLLSIPVVPLTNSNSKQNRQQTTVKTKSTIAQPKVISETVTNSNKQHPTTASSTRLQNTVKIQQQKNEIPSAWTTHESTQNTPVASTSTLLATAPVFVPSSSLLISKQTNDLLSIEQPTSSLYWDPNGYLIPPGPVQRPNSSFSPAPGPRCIRRPSPESLSTYSPLNYTMGNSTSTWNETSERNPNDSQWKYPYEEQPQTSNIPNDFPLYDPFNSGASLTIAPSSLLTNDFEDHLHIPQDNDANEMDAFDKEIEDFKKCYIDNLPLDSRDKRQGNIDHRFIRQS